MALPDQTLSPRSSNFCSTTTSSRLRSATVVSLRATLGSLNRVKALTSESGVSGKTATQLSVRFDFATKPPSAADDVGSPEGDHLGSASWPSWPLKHRGLPQTRVLPARLPPTGNPRQLAGEASAQQTRQTYIPSRPPRAPSGRSRRGCAVRAAAPPGRRARPAGSPRL